MVMSVCQGVVTYLLLLCFMTNGIPDPTQRDLLMRQEASRQTGGRVALTEPEQKLDAYLHRLKEQEMSATQFPPALHFFKAKPLIQKSSIFKLLQKMPKGDVAANSMWGTVWVALISRCSADRCSPPHPQFISGQRWVAGEKRHLQTSLLHLLYVGQLGPLPVLRSSALPAMGLLLLAAAPDLKSQNKRPYRIW